MSCDLSGHDQPKRLRACTQIGRPEPYTREVNGQKSGGQGVQGDGAQSRKAGPRCGQRSRSSRGERSCSAGVLRIEVNVDVRRTGARPVPLRTLVTIIRQGRGRSESAEKWSISRRFCRVAQCHRIAWAGVGGVSGKAWRRADSSKAVTAWAVSSRSASAATARAVSSRTARITRRTSGN